MTGYKGTSPENMPVELLPALSRMVIDITDGGDPVQHTNDVLAANGLTRL